jgi:hypothetical protein
MLRPFRRWEGENPCTTWQESSCFASCEVGRDSKGTKKEDEQVPTHRWRYCTSYFPSTSFPGNGSSSAGVSAVLGVGLAGAEDGMGRTNDRGRPTTARRTRVTTTTKVLSMPPDRGQIGPPPPALTSPRSIVHRSTMGELDGTAGNGLSVNTGAKWGGWKGQT